MGAVWVGHRPQSGRGAAVPGHPPPPCPPAAWPHPCSRPARPHRPARPRKQKSSSKKCFDSADWALAKEGRQCEEPLEAPIESLPHKLQPTTPVLPRRHSNLGDC